MKAKDYLKISSTPEKLFNAIPKNPADNIAFRKELHTFLFEDEKAKTDFLAKCLFDSRIFFNSTLWTFDSRSDVGYKHVPFILWPHQEPAVRRIRYSINNRKNLLFWKSRTQGATYIILGNYLLDFVATPGSRFLIGSRKEELVDTGSEIITNPDGTSIVAGSEETLFYKILYMLSTLPLYLQPRYSKKNLFLQNLELDTAIKGEATNIGFGKAYRTTSTLVDEAAQIDPKMASWIIENIADTSYCNIFNSTSGPWGDSHPYDKMMKSHPKDVVILDWLDNPSQNAGKYRSPKEGFIEIADIDYYRKLYPGRFEGIKPNTIIPVNKVEGTYPFIADGGVSNWSCWRTVWYDKEEKRPDRTKRGLAQNVLRINTGAVDSFFDYDLVKKLREKVREPDYFGDVSYDRNSGGKLENIKFGFGSKESPLYWWGQLPNRRPNQRHNYVVACDISRGTGTSNSVASIKDTNTNEICGLYVNPYIKVSDFAEKAVAICYWIGGVRPALLNWETNNSPEFLDRVKELGYYNLYRDRKTDTTTSKLSKKYGWTSTGGMNGTKREVLNELGASLSEGLLDNPRFSFCRIYDKQLVDEIESYVNYEGKIDVGPVALQTETSGAKAAHGDRVIAVALAELGSKSQTKADERAIVNVPRGSFMERMLEVENREAAERAAGKIWLF